MRSNIGTCDSLCCTFLILMFVFKYLTVILSNKNGFKI